uniref:hypothetical protein n=1 Tax=Pedobacter schmidteae TaxID=2201271 RepID=UPI0013CF1663|nr:hypothetical protein [Pedobacter schmidteae]
MKCSNYVLFVMLSLSLLSCKKAIKTNPIAAPVIPTDLTSLYIPIKFETDGLSLSLSYKENTAQLTELTDQNGDKVKISYTTSQLPSKLEHYRNGQLFYVAYFEQQDKKNTNKAVLFDCTAQPLIYTPRGNYLLTYDEQNISILKYYNNSGNLVYANTWLYASGNLSQMSSTNPPGTPSLTTFTFDQKKGISSHIPYTQLFVIELDYWFLRCANNNIVSQQSTSNQVNYSYEYNDQGYPLKVKISDQKRSQTIKVTYQQLKP